ncbi:MAG: GtrA family protein [Bacilli bacterium]|nr:GtrA family protein [Bacilli bacterium]
MNRLLSIYKKNEEIINYLIVGGLTTLISIVVKWGLLFTILDAKNSFQLQLAIIISWIVAVTFAFFANKYFVFKSKTKKIIKEIFDFLVSRIATLLLEMFLMWLFINLLKFDSKTWVMIWTLIVQFVVIVCNYILSKLFVFKK